MPRSTCSAISSCRWPTGRRPLRRRVVGRGLSDRRDEGLRSQVLAAVQGRHRSRSTPSRAITTGTTRSRRSPRRSFQADAARASDPRSSRGRPAGDQHDRRADRRADSRGGTAAHGVRRPDGLSARAVLRAPDRSVRADRDRHRRPQDDRPGAGRLARGGADTRATGKSTMAILGHPFFAGGHDLAAGDEAFTRLKQLLLRRGVTIVMAGDTHDLEYYAEPRLRGGARRAPLRQRRRRRLSEFRDRARLACAPRHDRLGATIPTRDAVTQKIRSTNALVEAAGVVVDAAVRRLAVLGGMALGRVRLQRRAVLPELRRSARRAIREPRAPDSVRRPWAPHLGRGCRLGWPAGGRRGRSCPGRMGRAYDVAMRIENSTEGGPCRPACERRTQRVRPTYCRVVLPPYFGMTSTTSRGSLPALPNE